jgi:CMP-N-acetylneuraminic acid synthetase
MSVVAIIPARGGSKRLPGKNLHPVLGVPMIAWVIRACRDAHRISDVYVSTEDPEIARVAREWGAGVIDRPPALAVDDVPKQDAIVDAVEQLLAAGRTVDIVLSVQPNSPELTGKDLDGAVAKLLAHDLRELFSVDTQLIQNGAFRVMRRDTVFWRSLSVHCGVSVADCVDVHTREDVAAVERRLRQRVGPAGTPVSGRRG